MNEFIDSGKKAKKKADYIFNNNNINNELKIQNNYILLSNKNNLLNNRHILEQYFDKKLFFKYNESKTNSDFSKSTQEI